MTDTRWATLRLRDALSHAADADFAEDALGAVATIVPYDGYCLFGTDPITGLRTFMLSRRGLDGAAPRLAYNETVEQDVNRYADLAASRIPVGTLGGTSTDAWSPRMNDLLRPAGFGSEMRMALRSGKTRWGALTLYRDRGSRPFTNDDVTVVARLHDALEHVVRSRPLRPRSAIRPPELGPGVVLLDEANRLLSVSPEAASWIQDLCAGGTDEMSVDDMMRVVYDAANAARASEATPAPMSRIRTTSGRWLAIQGTPVSFGAATIAVVLQPATVHQLLPAVTAWLGLTRREGDLLSLLVDGLPAKQIASMLGLSTLTVNTHLRAIYRKAGVTGREQLLAQIR